MKKETGIRKMTKPVAAALCAAALFVSAAPAYAEELVAEDTQTVGAREATRYDLQNNGDSWDNAHYYLADGTLAKDCFFSDGVYTYYLQSDGSPMTNRLTYHPDGEHIIYFDENGHEVPTGTVRFSLLSTPLASWNTRVSGTVLSLASGAFRSSSMTW